MAGKSVAERLKELYAQFPGEKYIWITPQIVPSGSLPEHIDFTIERKKLNPDPDKGQDFYWQQEPTAAKGNRKADEGWLSPAGPALYALASAAGLKWVPQLNARVDDGSRRHYVKWTATGLMASLSGMGPITKTKEIDLDEMLEEWEYGLRRNPPWKIYPPASLHDYGDPADWKNYNAAKKEGVRWEDATPEEQEDAIQHKLKQRLFQVRTHLLSMAETKCQLRVIRSALAIPHRFRPSEVKAKPFAILRIIFNPVAKSAGERKLILSRLMDNYLSAFPGSAGLLSQPPGSGAAQLAAGSPEVAGLLEEPEVEELPDGVTWDDYINRAEAGEPEPQEQETPAQPVAAEASQEPQPADPGEGEASAAGPIEEKAPATGEPEQAEPSASPPMEEKAAASPPPPLNGKSGVASARQAIFAKLDVNGLIRYIDQLAEEKGYNPQDDTLGINQALSSGDHKQLVTAAVALSEWKKPEQGELL